jgi:hypothetical protein
MSHQLEQFFPASPDSGEGHIFVPCFSYSSIVQGNWILVPNVSQLLNGFIRNDSQISLDQVNFSAFLQKGTYTFKSLVLKATNAGIQELLIDGDSMQTWDNYNNPAVYNTVNSLVDISVPTSKIVTIGLRVNGKNAASTSYFLYLSGFTLYRTT